MNRNGGSEPRILSSWKDIARYTGRGVRTLQRYEQRFGLPVHRLSNDSRGSVMAFVHEIDAWLNQAPMHQQIPGSNGACPRCLGRGILEHPGVAGERKRPPEQARDDKGLELVHSRSERCG
jgi:hypothetical protein